MSRRFKTPGTVFLLDIPPATAGEEFVYLIQRRLSDGIVLGANHDDQIVGHGGQGFRCQQVTLGQDVFVGIGRHHYTRVEDTRQSGQGALQLHEDDRVVIDSGSNFRPSYCHSNLRRI